MQTVTTNPTIVWDDGAVLVFSFQDSGKTLYGGILHLVSSAQSTTGTQTEVSKLVQSIAQSTVQISQDPATWIETIKYGSRPGQSNTITIAYDDTLNFNYTPAGSSNPYTLQQIYAIYG